MTTRSTSPLPEDLRVFLAVIRKSSFAAAARDLGVSPAFISKRLRILEQTLQARLLHRNTGSIALTEAGEKTKRWATRFLDEMDDFVGELTTVRNVPRGLLHICSSFGFGRNHVAPAVAQLSSTYPELEVRLDVFDRVVDIVAEGFDLEIRVGDDLPGHYIGRKLACNQRVLCATPAYLQKRGLPKTISELGHHECLVIKERSNPFGIWRLSNVEGEEVVRVGSRLSSNNGEIALQWALNDLGIILRSLWDVQPLLEQGRLVRVLPEYTQSANVWAVYPTRLADSAKLRVCVEFLQRYFNMTLLGN